jgi:hypothetical protein
MGRVFKRDGRWAIDYIDHKNRRVRKVVSTDKGVAQRVLADEMENVERRKAGILITDPAEAARPIQEHIDGYVGELERRGRASMYSYNVRRHLENAAWAQDWQTVKDATPKSVASYLKDLADGRQEREDGEPAPGRPRRVLRLVRRGRGGGVQSL